MSGLPRRSAFGHRSAKAGRCRVVLIVAALSIVSLVVAAQGGRDVAYERAVITAGAGPQRLAIDGLLLSAGAPFRVVRRGDLFVGEDGLADLRLFAEGDRPVPYLLVEPPTGEREWVGGAMLGIAATRKTSGFEVDLGAARAIDMVRIGGLPVPHLKRLTLEGSGDRARWTMLVAEGTLFDLPDEKLRQNVLEFTPGAYRYLRAVWNDANSGRVPLPTVVEARLASASPPPPATKMVAAVQPRPSEPGVSRFRVVLPAAALPIVALDLDVGGGHVYRRATVMESRFAGVEAAPVDLGSAMLSRVTREGVTASALRIPIVTPREAELELAIDDGANPPLEVRSVAVVLAQLPWIYFEAPAERIVARYGNRTLAKPVYDLEAVRASVDLARLPEARWAESGATSRTIEAAIVAPPPPGGSVDVSIFKHSRAIVRAQAGLVSLPLDAHALAFSRGPAGRFADVRILDGENRQVPYLIERRNEPLSIDLPFKSAVDVKAPTLRDSIGSRRRSVYTLTLPYQDLPPGTLVIQTPETPPRVFQRTVEMGFDRPADKRRRDAWFDVQAVETWRHADEQTPARPLTLRLASAGESEVTLVVDEGDNAQLPISAVRLLLPSYRLRFYHPANGPLRLVYGRRDLQAPQYDLSLLAARVMGASAPEVSTTAATDVVPAPQDTFVSPTTFWIVLSGAVLVLLALIVKLIRGSDTVQRP